MKIKSSEMQHIIVSRLKRRRLPNINELEFMLRPYIKHEQGCTYHAVDQDEGEYCSCNKQGRRLKIANVILEMLWASI